VDFKHGFPAIRDEFSLLLEHFDISQVASTAFPSYGPATSFKERSSRCNKE
jgi:hypothetical protein